MDKPNLILITIDALRPSHLGFMGYKKGSTPNIDRFAAESVVFDNAFSVGPTTPYSFPSILTSTYPLDFTGPKRVEEPRVLLSETLKDQGFLTAAFHSTPYLSEYFGYNKGWDFFQDISFYTKSGGNSRLKKIFNKITVSFFPTLFFWAVYLKYKIKGPKKVRAKASYVNKVVRDFVYSAKGEGKPMFIWIHYMDTHTPPPCYQEGRVCTFSEIVGDAAGAAIWSYGNKGALKNYIKRNFKKHLAKTLGSYDESIQSIDNELGSLFNFFKKQGIYQNSVVCVTSDHGDEFLEHGGVGHNIQLYNEVLSVPLMIKFPKGAENKNTKIRKKVSLIDLAPTLCDLVGVKKDLSYKGRNLFDKSTDLQNNFIFHQAAFSEIEGRRLEIERLDQCRMACQSESWKYITDYGTKKEELYNLKKDPGEKNNVVGSFPEIARNMKNELEKFKKENPPLNYLKSVAAIVQARMGSTRLPGKVLLPICSKPLLGHIIDRLKASKLINQIVLAIPDTKENDVLENFAKENSVPYFRGSENDVLERCYLAAKANNVDVVVRILADNPLIDPGIIDKVIKSHLENKSDFSWTRTPEQILPWGMEVDVFNFNALEKAHIEAKENKFREHVSPYFYENQAIFKINSVSLPEYFKNSNLRLTVDTKEDFEFISRIYVELYGEGKIFSLKDIVGFLEKESELKKLIAI